MTSLAKAASSVFEYLESSKLLLNKDGVMQKKIAIYQIFYDWESRRQVMPGFIPLDNTRSPHPDWFELWPIMDFLNRHTLDEDCWYGFLSPKFQKKTNLDSKYVIDFILNNGARKNVTLFSPYWEQLTYFKNPWEQGELWHPGITSLTQRFLDDTNRNIKIENIVTDTRSSVFCNYVVAKKNYWIQWHALATEFFYYVETQVALDAQSPFAGLTRYGSKTGYPMKTFLQERLASLLLATQDFDVITPDTGASAPISRLFFRDGETCRPSLQSCDFMKSSYRNTGDRQYLDMYSKIRDTIHVTVTSKINQ